MLPGSPRSQDLGDFPTPLTRVEVPTASGATAPLWIKNDGLANALYGGNKVRKLREVLRIAEQRGKRRIVTFGAAGSHHVLATTLFGRQRGLGTAAILTPQPYTPHAADTLRAAMGAGLQAVPVAAPKAAALALAKLVTPRDLLVGPGALGTAGARSYADAVAEVLLQFEELECVAPTNLVVAVGSGGTAAGLLAGVVAHDVDCEVVGVCAGHDHATRGLVLSQAALALRSLGRPVSPQRLVATLRLDRSQTGVGYGHPGPDANRARHAAHAVGLNLDPTYTEKAFAVAASLAEREKFQSERKVGLGVGPRTLYWHTLSAAPMGPLLANAPAFSDLPRAVRQLLEEPRPGAAR